MGNLFLNTLIMMGLTFVIGFVVAGIIWFISFCATAAEVQSVQQKKVDEIKRWRRLRHKVEFAKGFYSPANVGDADFELSSYYEGSDITRSDKQDRNRFYHETSVGSSDYGLMDFYYPNSEKGQKTKKSKK